MSIKKLVVVLVVVSSVTFSALAAKVPGVLKSAQKSLDTSDSVQVAVFESIESYENGFEGVLGDPLNETERQELINWWVEFPDVMNKGRMAVLREAEVSADSARHVTVAIEGQSDSVFFVQEMIQPGATTNMKMLQWTFDVPFEERKDFARSMFSRIQKLFSKDRKWMKSGTEDASLNPLYGQLSLVYTLKGSMRGSQMLMLSVDYGQTREIHDLSGGVLLKVYTMDIKF